MASNKSQSLFIFGKEEKKGKQDEAHVADQAVSQFDLTFSD